MAYLKNYFFGRRVQTKDDNRIEGLIDYRGKEPFCASGLVLNRPGFPDNSSVITSLIESVSNGEARTRSGSIYTLLEFDPDYLDFLSAIDQNIPIIRNPKIRGNLRQGYYIDNCLVVSQDGNFVTILDNSKKEVTVFIDWTTVMYNDPFKIFVTGCLMDGTDLRRDDLENFCGIPCKVSFTK